MTRIIAGELSGRRLATPPGDRTRPTTDRVREALFGSLEASRDLDGVRFLDLYAGSGAVGLEACSRGAAFVVFVEAHRETARLLRRNAGTLGVRDRTHVLAGKVSTALAVKPDERFDIAFADPPYDLPEDELAKVLAALVDHGWPAEDADVIVERAKRSPAPRWPEGITPIRSRNYGETTLWYGRAS